MVEAVVAADRHGAAPLLGEVGEHRLVGVGDDLHVLAAEHRERRRLEARVHRAAVEADELRHPRIGELHHRVVDGLLDHVLAQDLGAERELRADHRVDLGTELRSRHAVDHRPHHGAVRIDRRLGLVGGNAARLVETRGLPRERGAARLDRRSKQHAEGERALGLVACVLPHRDDRRDHRAFAVTDDADACGVDAGLLLEPAAGGIGIAREIERGRAVERARRCADAAVVAAEHGDALAQQRIGDDGERAVSEQLLVAILRARAGDEQHGGNLAVARELLARGHRERAREHVARGMRDAHLDLAIRQRRNRILRAARARQMLARGVHEVDRTAEVPLRESAVEDLRLGVLRHVGLEGDARRRADRQAELEALLGARHVDREPADALRCDLDRAAPAMRAFGEREHHRNLLPERGEVSLVDARVRLLGREVGALKPQQQRRLHGRAVGREERKAAEHAQTVRLESAFKTRLAARRIERESKQLSIGRDIVRDLCERACAQRGDLDQRRSGAFADDDRDGHREGVRILLAVLVGHPADVTEPRAVPRVVERRGGRGDGDRGSLRSGNLRERGRGRDECGRRCDRAGGGDGAERAHGLMDADALHGKSLLTIAARGAYRAGSVVSLGVQTRHSHHRCTIGADRTQGAACVTSRIATSRVRWVWSVQVVLGAPTARDGWLETRASRRDISALSLPACGTRGARRGTLAFGSAPINALAVGVEKLEVVVEPLIRLEQMHDDLDEVDDDPGRAFVGVGAVRVLPALLAKILDLLRRRPHLPLAGARADDHEVADLAATADIEKDHFRALGVGERARHFDRELARVLGV